MSSSLICSLLVVVATSTAHAGLWNERTSMPSPGRHHPVTFTLDGYGYVVTGSTSGAGATDDFFRYDPVGDSWAVLPDFPGPDRGYAYGGAYGGKGYLGFGLAVGSTYLADLWEYDPTTGTWAELTSLPGQPRTHPAFVITDDGKIYVGCGGSAIGNLGDWWEYDIATDSWLQHDDLPGPRRHHPYYFNIGDVPYVGFGHGGGIYRDFYRFDPITDTWTRMTDFPGEGRVAGTQFSWDGKGYVLSGEGTDHVQLDQGEFWQYDGDTDTWIQLPPHPGSGRWAPGSFLIGDSLYFLAGLSTSRLEWDLWTYEMGPVVGADDPLTPSTTTLLHAPHPNPFRASTVVRFDLASSGNVVMNVFDAAGRAVRSIAVDGLEAGRHSLAWDGRTDRGERVAPGVYFVRLTSAGALGASGRDVTRTVTVLR